MENLSITRISRVILTAGCHLAWEATPPAQDFLASRFWWGLHFSSPTLPATRIVGCSRGVSNMVPVAVNHSIEPLSTTHMGDPEGLSKQLGGQCALDARGLLVPRRQEGACSSWPSTRDLCHQQFGVSHELPAL